MGSKELLQPLRQAGLRAELTTLDSADICFAGNGPNGDVQVGIERKTLPDLIASLQSGRLQGLPTENGAGQLHRMRETYDYCWLLVEGSWEVDRSGRIVRRRRGGVTPVGTMTQDSLRKQLLSMRLKAGLLYDQTIDQRDTVQWIATTFRWFTDKSWEGHKTLETTYQPQRLVPISDFSRHALQFTGVGLGAARALDKHFQGNLSEMLHASVSDLSTVTIHTPAGPRALGTAKAERIHAACQKLIGE